MTEKQILASVIIPVKNGLPAFEGVVDALRAQETDFNFEVIIIDSGSKDGSLELAKKEAAKPDSVFRVVEIPSSEFGHGKTRNYGAEIARGEYCAYLTHDAKPYDRSWLSNLVKPLREDDRVAGVFGKHVAYPEAGPYTTWELDKHFESFSDHGIVEITDARKYVSDVRLRQFYHFYSDNSSCLRKSVWEEIPYPDTNFAEDQIFAKKILESGYKKAYAEDSVVYHSHDFNVWETFQRTYEETCAFYDLFGYELCKTFGQSIRNWLHITKRDVGLGLKKGWFLKHPGKFFMRPFRNGALVLGQYFGTTNPAFMKSRKSFFSKDQKLKEA